MMPSQIVGHTDAELEAAAARLKAGKLVAFPTETVYGLGGNALNEETVRRIYSVKGRPATDPLICHVAEVRHAAALWDPQESAVVALGCYLGAKLWPGPLTLVARAEKSLPRSVTGGSGFVGARIPKHDVTLRLLHLLGGLPIAGPSANTFGHVSPTTAAHVVADLGVKDPELTVIDGGPCAIGIESTVVKVCSGKKLEILRRGGGVTVSLLQAALRDQYPDVEVTIRDTRVVCQGQEAVAMDGPGQLLTHYAPRVPAFMVTPASFGPSGIETSSSAPGSSHWRILPAQATMGDAVILDFGGLLAPLRGRCKSYRTLSASGNPLEACRVVFDALRWTETIAGGQVVLFPFLTEWRHAANMDQEVLEAVEDRLFRAASGRVCTFSLG